MSYKIDEWYQAGYDMAKKIGRDAEKKIEDEMGEKSCPCCGGTRVFRDGVWVGKERARIIDYLRETDHA